MKSLIFFPAIFFAHFSFGQTTSSTAAAPPILTFGMRAGGNYSMIAEENDFKHIVGIPGMRLDLFAEAQTKLPSVTLELGLGLEQKGVRQKFDDIYILTNYLSGSFSMRRRFRSAFAFVGIYYSKLIAKYLDGEDKTYFQDEFDALKKTDVGWRIGTGIRLAKKLRLHISYNNGWERLFTSFSFSPGGACCHDEYWGKNRTLSLLLEIPLSNKSHLLK